MSCMADKHVRLTLPLTFVQFHGALVEDKP